MGALQIAAVIILLVASVHLWIVNTKNKKLFSMVSDQIKGNQDVRRTLAMGLYSRFRKKEYDKEGNPIDEKLSEMFLREEPHDFEDFVARIYERLYGGSACVTSGSGDYGVDIEHRIGDKVVYIQVKCEKSNQPFDPIAKVHSNMVKHGADAGIVVSVSDFTENAKKYAEGINVELINGVQLVDMWIKSLQTEKEQIQLLNPENI
ncbi:restriction endonuclease [Evansella tamaricis]|uniref:Restriction endonuclease n=1 Tax=Evansella tamaricis TaxID=2069301 RepID=A0ABS6JCW2_9BACI|nr:restriction endonuclease [Evansella tamaricis]MBU9711039.1 restriction endonuclease [Evansella tamaricis]